MPVLILVRVRSNRTAWGSGCHFNPAARPEATTTEATFAFTNSGTEPVSIRSVRTSCGCTVADASTKTYAPGEGGQIKVTFTQRRISMR
ncbi:MAG: DUF1573 domain-containing protein [Roseimicrobium sp.]